MNNLSWMIYLAGVAGSLGVALVLLAIGTAATCAIGVVYGAHLKDESYRDKYLWQEGHEVQRFWLRALGVPIALLLLRIPIPSQDTVYAIAASELGEQALHSPTGSKAVQALEAWLDRQIAKDEETNP